MQGNTLNSWKDIADFFGKSIRTVQRWHAVLALPVHHDTDSRRVAVSRDELHAWLRNLTNSRNGIALLEAIEAPDYSELLLSSWKDIAAYMGRSVRTVQRWEQLFGLPVRRPSADDAHIVLALKPEIDAWAGRYALLTQGRSPVASTADQHRPNAGTPAQTVTLRRAS